MTENREFKGVWIPREIWLDERLNMLEKGILTEIDSLDNENGCSAGNDYLAKFCQCSATKVSTAIKKLIDLGYIYMQSFDGRIRILKSRLSNFERQDLKNLNSDFKNFKVINIDNNKDIKINNNIIAQSNQVANEPALYKLQLNDNSYFEVTQSFYDELKPLYPAVDLDNEFKQMVSWIIGNPKKRKTKSGIKRFITSWLSREQNNGGHKYYSEKKATVSNNYTESQINNLITDLDNIKI